MRTVAILCAMALLLCGCGADLFSLTAAPPGYPRANFEDCLKKNGFLKSSESANSFTIASRFAHGFAADQSLPPNDYPNPAEQPGFIHLFLDCWVGYVSPSDGKGRLLRGHIVTTLLAQYGAETLLTRTRSAKPADAARMITDIARAELLLSADSPEALQARYALKLPAEAATQLERMTMLGNMAAFYNAARVAAVLEVGIDIESVNSREFLNTAKSLISVVATKSPAAMQDVLQSAAEGIVIALNADWYGKAFRYAAQQTLASGNYLQGWKDWDVRMKAACADLQALAKATSGCFPTSDTVVSYFKSEFGDGNAVVLQFAKQAADAALKKAQAADDAANKALNSGD